MGTCGWTGAPCTAGGGILSPARSNCNNRADAYICVNGSCGFKLGDKCDMTGKSGQYQFSCNGDIMCGFDNKCGGRDAFLKYGGVMVGNNEQVSTNIMKERCMSGVANSQSSGGYSCTDPADPYGKKRRLRLIVGPVVGGVVALLLVAIGYLILRKRRRPSTVDPHPPPGPHHVEVTHPLTSNTSSAGITNGPVHQPTEMEAPDSQAFVEVNEVYKHDPTSRILSCQPVSLSAHAISNPPLLETATTQVQSSASSWQAPLPAPVSSSLSAASPNPPESDVHAELAALRAQVAQLQATTLSPSPGANLSGSTISREDSPPPYTLQDH
ncbi:hypothetical protein M413DRAFT_442973 [Hebeloma cylindrosporum]|uniref:Uncharacterized protein n=1 Tax=Hebeloma cylindrosporum TaxID=76867 RepID=A0A0C2YS93_HEBCY|nr:hypothetical protein M413DRAFT_442973 [Hebeloma cylindrosporum h7]